MTEPRALLRALFDAAVAAADPAVCVPPQLPAPPEPGSGGRTIVLGAGKAAAAIARAVERYWRGGLEGFVVTRYGHGADCRRIEVVEAAHPVPDEAGLDAARRILAAAEGAGSDDLILFLLSGGASALLTLPAAGVSLEEKRRVTRALLASGAPIGEFNAVRKHLSAIKGGRLAAAAHPARVVTLAISDVVGDDPSVIGSGPTVADPTTREEARAVLGRYGIEAPSALSPRHDGNTDAETPKPGDPRLARADWRLCAAPADAMTAARETAARRGLIALDLGVEIEGDAATLGREHARAALRLAADAEIRKPLILMSGGEATVTLPEAAGNGGGGAAPATGGPNTEYLLALTLELDGAPGIWALAADTDGSDGNAEAAGAIVAPDTLARARAAGLDPAGALAAHDSAGLFGALGDLLVTGPTRTNVNDFRAILIGTPGT